MKLLLNMLRTSKRLTLLTVLFGLLSGASSAALIAFINEALTRDSESALGEVALSFVGLALTALLARLGSQLLLNKLQQDILFNLRLRLSRHLLTTSLGTLEKAGSHRMLSSLVQDIVTLGQSVTMLPDIFINSATIVGCLAYLAWLSWPMCLAVLAFMALGQVTYSLPASAAMRNQHQAREHNTSLFKRFMALSEGAKELRMNRRRRLAFFDKELTPLAGTVRQHALRSENLFALANSWGMFLYVFIIGLLLFAVPRFMALPPGMLLSAVLVVLYLQQPLSSVIGTMSSLGRSAVAISHIEQLGMKLVPESSPDKALPAVAAADPRSFELLELDGVSHTYRHERDDEKFTLGPISFQLRQGELVFLVGGNGSGKTTLAKILTGLYAPQEGQLRLDGQPVTPETLDDYRQHFSAVFFDFYLFERLLELGSPELLQRAGRFLEELHLEKKVRIQEDGTLSTIELSQGQRKRLALLGAYLEDRPLYVFDEWAADQDPLFKEVFYKKLLPDLKSRGKAVVVISHDDRYFHLADRVLRLESGQLVSDSRPDAPRANALSA